MHKDSTIIAFFDVLSNQDVALVGGKNASLGELHQHLARLGVRVPEGFAVTAYAYRSYLEHHGLWPHIAGLLDSIERPGYGNLAEVGRQIRELFFQHPFPAFLVEAIYDAHHELCRRIGEEGGLAVRSSATAEDLPTASFAGQQESYLNVRGKDALIEACLKCYASLFTDRAIVYREANHFEHASVALSIGVQRMVRSDKGAAGVGFTIEPESGHPEIMTVSGSWGLGENVVKGTVNPDEFYLFKPSLRTGKHAVVQRKLGSKSKTMVNVIEDTANESPRATTINIDTDPAARKRFVLSTEELTTLGAWMLSIEQHYKMPMDIEWAKDGITQELFIVQARPETVHANRKVTAITEYRLHERSRVLAKGEGLGNTIVAGRARLLSAVVDPDEIAEDEIIVTEITDPDSDPILRKARAIITDRGGRTSHAAIVAREIGTAAVVGCGTATRTIPDGAWITVVCSEGEVGMVYEGMLEWDAIDHDLGEIPSPRTKVMLIVGDPDQAFVLSRYPVQGVGLLRLEFAINNAVRIHPMALARFDLVEDPTIRAQIEELTYGYSSKQQYFVEKLSEAIGTIAASFYPREVIVRLSDFKTNEYSKLIGGRQFEPREENPMLGFRGASRYYDDRYREGFALECQAIKRVREEMGLMNVKIMVPFCRTIAEAREVIRTMEAQGLRRGVDGLEIYVMAEIPSNILLARQFAKEFDGFSIGSNDLTQLTLGIDRDSALVRHLFDERNEAVRFLISELIQVAHEVGRPVGLCGQAPSDHPEFAQFLVEEGIDSISFSPDAVFRGIQRTHEAEVKTGRVVSELDAECEATLLEDYE